MSERSNLIPTPSENERVGSYPTDELINHGEFSVGEETKLQITIFETKKETSEWNIFHRLRKPDQDIGKIHEDIDSVLKLAEKKFPKLYENCVDYNLRVILDNNLKPGLTYQDHGIHIVPYSTESVMVIPSLRGEFNVQAASHEMMHYMLIASYGHTRDHIIRELPALALSGSLLPKNSPKDIGNDPQKLVEIYKNSRLFSKAKSTIKKLFSDDNLPVSFAELAPVLKKHKLDIPIGSWTEFQYLFASVLSLKIKEKFPEDWLERILSVYSAAVELERNIRETNDYSRFEFKRDHIYQILSQSLELDDHQVTQLLTDVTEDVWH